MTRRGFLESLFNCLPGSYAKADWDVDRRGFIGWILSVLATVFMWPFTPSVDPKTALISQALETKEGRELLAQAMVEPIRMQLDYQAFGRRMLFVEPLPEGALARYEREIRAVATELSRRDGIKQETGLLP